MPSGCVGFKSSKQAIQLIQRKSLYAPIVAMLPFICHILYNIWLSIVALLTLFVCDNCKLRGGGGGGGQCWNGQWHSSCFFLQATRDREDLQFIDPSDRQLQREISTEKFTVLVKDLFLFLFCVCVHVRAHILSVNSYLINDTDVSIAAFSILESKGFQS